MKIVFIAIVWLFVAEIQAQISSTPYRFEIEITKEIEAEKFELEVPENRSDPETRKIPLRFIKLESRAETPANPIVYLAGGPGGSGSRAMRGQRWLLFDKLRDVADVIILDQRGTGLSDLVPPCTSSIEMPADSAATRERFIRLHRQAAWECLAFWKTKGIDIRGYTTWESAADIEAVRKALGAERLNLLAISYGTHLALATLKRYPERIDRLVLASPEGLNQTVKLPSHTEAYFDRLQEAIDLDSATRKIYPDVRGLIRSVLEEVENNPRSMLVDDDPEFYHTLGKFELQRITGYMLSDPDAAASILEGYLDASQGNFNWFKNYFDWYVRDNQLSFNGMALAMDLASGISEKRLAQVRKEAQNATLGDAINFPVPQLLGLIEDIDLSEGFRASFRSNRPALLLSGTLDGRTYPEAHAQIAQQFDQAAVVTIKNAGHNPFFSHEALPEIITEFFNGAPPKARELQAPLPSFLPD